MPNSTLNVVSFRHFAYDLSYEKCHTCPCTNVCSSSGPSFRSGLCSLIRKNGYSASWKDQWQDLSLCQRGILDNHGEIAACALQIHDIGSIFSVSGGNDWLMCIRQLSPEASVEAQRDGILHGGGYQLEAWRISMSVDSNLQQVYLSDYFPKPPVGNFQNWIGIPMENNIFVMVS